MEQQIPIHFSTRRGQQSQQSSFGGGSKACSCTCACADCSCPSAMRSKQQQQSSLQSQQMLPQQQQQQQQQQQRFGVGAGQLGASSGLSLGLGGGKMSVVNVQGNLNLGEIGYLNWLCKLEGTSYMKNHMLRLLSLDQSGHIKRWHTEVTKQNYDQLIQMMHTTGLPLPFSVTTEQRENDFKRALGHIREPIVMETEALTEICMMGCSLAHIYSEAFMVSTNEQARELFHACCARVCLGFTAIKKALQAQPDYIAPPLVKELAISMPSGGQGFFGQQQQQLQQQPFPKQQQYQYQQPSSSSSFFSGSRSGSSFGGRGGGGAGFFGSRGDIEQEQQQRESASEFGGGREYGGRGGFGERRGQGVHSW